MSSKSKGGLQLLHEEKQRLRAECKDSEDRLMAKFDTLKATYPQILTDIILPFESDTNQTIKEGLGILNSVLFSKLGSAFKDKKNSEVWMRFVLQIAQLFTIRGVYNWFSKKKKAEK
jgi:hypothetical protein